MHAPKEKSVNLTQLLNAGMKGFSCLLRAVSSGERQLVLQKIDEIRTILTKIETHYKEGRTDESSETHI